MLRGALAMKSVMPADRRDSVSEKLQKGIQELRNDNQGVLLCQT
jgi:hypothetical protein